MTAICMQMTNFVEVKKHAWVAEALLTKQECEDLVARATAAGIESSPAHGEKEENRLVRDCLRVELDGEDALARAVWERLRDKVPPEVVIRGDEDEEKERDAGVLHPSEMRGRWTPCGVNPHWRIVCYPGRGFFGPHRDADYAVDEHKRSLLTVNGYLTDRPAGFGGATRFLVDDVPASQDDKGRYCTPEAAVTHRIEADKAGKAVVFFHGLMHDGEPLSEGSPPKWLFRTEVMYQRDPDSAPKLTPQQREARQLLGRAETAEARGDISEAMSMYSRAYRLDPSLDK